MDDFRLVFRLRRRRLDSVLRRLRPIGLTGLVANITGEAPEALSHDCYPAMADVVFQLAFCMITTAIITGSLAGRMKYGAICAFVAIWTIVVCPPLAHMVWGGDGSLIGDTIGALDFAGGDVVHISSGLTGLVLCLLLGKRKGFGMMSYRPHNVPFVALGATLLWVWLVWLQRGLGVRG